MQQSRKTKSACKEALKQANHVVAHFGDFTDIVLAQQDALTTLMNSAGDQAAVDAFAKGNGQHFRARQHSNRKSKKRRRTSTSPRAGVSRHLG